MPAVVSWVLSRRPWLSPAAQEALQGLFRRHDIRAERLVETAHDAAVCSGPARPVDVTALPVDWADGGRGSVFAPYRQEADDGPLQQDEASAQQEDASPQGKPPV